MMLLSSFYWGFNDAVKFRVVFLSVFGHEFVNAIDSGASFVFLNVVSLNPMILCAREQ